MDAREESESPNLNAKNDESRANVEQTPQDVTKKDSLLKRLWERSGLDMGTLISMLKGSLPPTIAIAMYQSQEVATVYQTLGYLVAISSVLGMAIMPRGMFIQNMLLNIIAICVAAATQLLALYCAVQARLHTTPAGTPPTGYNSSACAVLAVWLILQTYLTNALRAQLPQFQFPVILYSIFMIVSLTYGTQFPSMSYAVSFMERLMEAFLTGFALATGVSFLVFPISSRTIVFKEIGGYLNLVTGILATQAAYLRSLESFEPEVLLKQREEQSKGKKDRDKLAGKKPLLLATTPEALKMKELLEKLFALQSKLPADINFAKREIAIGKMSSKDLSDLWKQIRFLLIPITGLNAVLDILQRRAEAAGWPNKPSSEEEVTSRRRQLDNLHEMMHVLHEPFSTMSMSIGRALRHVLLVLEIEKPPKKKQDVESLGDDPAPGSPGFAEVFKRELDTFFESKKRSVREWCHDHDIDLPEDFFSTNFVHVERLESECINDNQQRQLFFVLYVEYLLWRAGQTALELVLHVDKKKQEGALSKAKLIVPGAKTLRKWVVAIFGREDISEENQFISDLDHGVNTSLYLGESYWHRKDPEHLPPQSASEKIGDAIRLVPRALKSDASAFGFRVVCATMSIAIICYLHDSQTWFLRNRILWAMIMVPISMTRGAGQSTWNFILRIGGTAIAMIGSYIIWYIVDGKTPGVIVFLWLWIFCGYYIVMKQPKLIIVGVLTVVTVILIIGYELQTRVVGIAVSESNGQPAYRTYLLAPYRLATVCGGLAIAYIWTIFPYPVSETTELRKDLGASMYLLANLYSIAHETIKARVKKIDGDHNAKGTRAYHLEKARLKVFNKLISLVNVLQQNSAFSKLQLRIGGRFPREEYNELIQLVQRVMQYLALVSYASGTFSSTAEDSEWSHDFRKVLASINATSHQITSLLSLLSASMLHARPLPPYLEIPQPYKLTQKIDSLDRDILSVRHIAEPEYSAFAVITVCAECMHQDLVEIVKHVKTLVGEIDFSFHVVSTADEQSVSSSESLDEKKEDSVV